MAMYKSGITEVDVDEKSLTKVIPDWKLPENHTIDFVSGTAVVEWDVEFEGRSWGVKNIYPIVQKVILDLKINVIDNENDKEFIYQYDLELDSVDSRLMILSPNNIQIFPTSLSFDNKDGWILEF